jgi:hypothetical protein
MWCDLTRRARSWTLVACAVGLVCAGASFQAHAQAVTNVPGDDHGVITHDTGSISRTPQRASRRQAPQGAGAYFVEFRSRYALSYGHTFLVHGRLNARGEVGQVTADQVAGLHPAGAGPEMWSVGHVLPVPSETGPSDGDMEDQYISARFRVVLSEEQYRRVSAHIRRKQKNSPTWHAVLYNCNRWVGEIAQYMGLDAPSNTLLYPADYINSLTALNSGGRHNNAAFTADRNNN